MIIKVEHRENANSEWIALTKKVRENSVEINRTLHKDGLPSISRARLTIRVLSEEDFELPELNECRLSRQENSDMDWEIVFTGFLRPLRSYRLDNNYTEIAVEMLDLFYLFKETLVKESALPSAPTSGIGTEEWEEYTQEVEEIAKNNTRIYPYRARRKLYTAMQDPDLSGFTASELEELQITDKARYDEVTAPVSNENNFLYTFIRDSFEIPRSVTVRWASTNPDIPALFSYAKIPGDKSVYKVFCDILYEHHHSAYIDEEGRIVLYDLRLKSVLQDGITIRHVDDLMKIGRDADYPLDGNYILDAGENRTIDFSSSERWRPIGSAEEPFEGTFEGNNHRITDIRMASGSDSLDDVGFFGVIGATGRVQNCSFEYAEGTNLRGSKRIGGVAGASAGSILACTVSGEISGSGEQVGGIVGENSGSVSQCVNNAAAVSGAGKIGGIAGVNSGEEARISECESNVRVQGSGAEAGGIVGQNRATIERSHAEEGSSIQASTAGGVAGSNEGRIVNCYSKALVGGSRSGGLVGVNAAGARVEKCYTTQEPLIGQNRGRAVSSATTPYSAESGNYQGWDFAAVWKKPGEGEWPEFWETVEEPPLRAVATLSDFHGALSVDEKKVEKDGVKITYRNIIARSNVLLNEKRIHTRGMYDGNILDKTWPIDETSQYEAWTIPEDMFGVEEADIVSHTNLKRKMSVVVHKTGDESRQSASGSGYGEDLGGLPEGGQWENRVFASHEGTWGSVESWLSADGAKIRFYGEKKSFIIYALLFYHSVHGDIYARFTSPAYALVTDEGEVETGETQTVRAKNPKQIELSYFSLLGDSVHSVSERQRYEQYEFLIQTGRALWDLEKCKRRRCSFTRFEEMTLGSYCVLRGIYHKRKTGESEYVDQAVRITSVKTRFVEGLPQYLYQAEIVEEARYAQAAAGENPLAMTRGGLIDPQNLSEMEEHRSDWVREQIAIHYSLDQEVRIQAENFAHYQEHGEPTEEWKEYRELVENIKRISHHRVETQNFEPYSFGEEWITIASAEDLEKIGRDVRFPLDGWYLLEDDLVLDAEFPPIGSISEHFDGIFEGNGKTIHGLRIYDNSVDEQGLFRVVGKDAKIRDLVIRNPQVTGRNYVGALAGVNFGTISGLHIVGGRITGRNWSGGLVGQSQGRIEVCSATSAVSGGAFTGGLAGRASGGRVYGSFASGRVSGSGKSTGGLVGEVLEEGEISWSHASGDVSSSEQYVGGLIGRNKGVVTKSYATGDAETLTTKHDVGGLIGENTGGTVSACYATGDADGKTGMGGLVGTSAGGLIAACHAHGVATGEDRYVGGLVGNVSGGAIVRDSYTTGNGRGGAFSAALVGRLLDGTVSSCYYEEGSNDASRTVGGASAGTTQEDIAGYARSAAGVLQHGGNTVAREDFSQWNFTGAWRWREDGQWPQLAWRCIDIEDAAQLAAIGHSPEYSLNAHYTLKRDIELEGEWSPIGSNTNHFTGTFDGAGHRISGLKIVAPATDYVGLFAVLGDGSEVRNLTIEDAHIEGDDYVGVLAGVSYGSIENLAIEDGTVSGADDVGGLVGRASSGSSISASYATGSVSGDDYLGGLVGYAWASSSISESYATGSVSGASHVGGLVGFAYGNSISESYATGSVSGAGHVGGLVGYVVSDSSISECYFDKDRSGQERGVGNYSTHTGVIGYDSSSTTLQHNGAEVTRTDFAGWDFAGSDAVWRWVAGRWPQLAAFSEEHQISLASDAEAADISISSEEELRKIGTDDAYPLDAHYTLTSNIELTAPIEPIGVNARSFTGHFDGAGHRITGLDIRRPGGHFTGLFSQIAVTGRIWDLRISSPHIEGGNYSGALAGRSFGSIENLAIEGGTVSGGRSVGGLVGAASSGSSISESYTTGSVSGDDYLGGLVGYAWASSSISESYATGSVSGADYVGGLVGYVVSGSSISESYATGSVSGDDYLGGLVGYAWASSSISESYATGSVSGADYVGGLVGYVVSGSSISESYATGSVSGASHVGGLVGYAWASSSISESYATGSVSGAGHVGGLVGYVVSDSSISECYFDKDRSGQERGVGNYSTHTGVIGYDSSSTTLQHNGAEVTRTDFAGWDFAGSDAVWRWVAGRWPQLAAFSEEHQISLASDAEAADISISSEEELRKIGTDDAYPLDAHYTLTSNIELTAPIEPIGVNARSFTGHFDGAGHRITGLDIRRPGGHFTGLFSQIAVTGRIWDLRISSPHIEGGNYSGALAGRSFGSIENLAIEGGTVSGGRSVGGLVGAASSGSSISESYTTGSVSGDDYLGGLVGYAWASSSISESYATGSVSGADYVGGLVGIAYGDISESYATGSVSGSSFVGGLVGSTDGDISASYFDSYLSGQTHGVGSNSTHTGVIGYDSSTATLQHNGAEVTQADFAGWSFSGSDAVWRWVAGRWPLLAWQPILISTEEELRKIGTDDAHSLNAHYELSADITLESEWSPIGSNADRFTGTFDGAGHRISGLKIVAPTTNHVGLFAALGGGSEVRNLTIEDAHIEGNNYVGGLVGIAYGDISESYATGSVSGASHVGGLVGYAWASSSISESYATGSVSGADYVGGLVGYVVSGSSISESYATGTVSGDDYVGGLVGIAYGDISESYATGSVSGASHVGGLVGYAWASSSISESYATGSVSGAGHVGGLVGYVVSDSSISECYFDKDRSGQERGVGNYSTHTGVIGYDSSSTTLQHNGAEVTRTDFAGWDFAGSDAVWRWVAGRWPQLAAFSEEHQISLASDAEAADISISSEEELRKIGTDDAYPLDAHYTLTSNIELTAPIEPIGVNARSFTGHFDGAGHRITGLDIRRPGGHFTGLFSQIAVTGRIWDLRISSPHIEGGNYSGALAGRSFGSIENLAIEGGTVSGDDSVGGLVGRASSGSSISESYATGTVSGDDYLGGLVGYAWRSSSISESYATGTVSGASHVGGLVGRASSGSSISESYATGSVSGNINIGGLVGYAYSYSSISESYATGSVSGNVYVGGLVGYAYSHSSISASYFDKDRSGQEEGIGSDERDVSTGVIGYDSSSTTLQRNGSEVTQADFAGWSFSGSDAVWRWVAGRWPLLAWQEDSSS